MQPNVNTSSPGIVKITQFLGLNDAMLSPARHISRLLAVEMWQVGNASAVAQDVIKWMEGLHGFLQHRTDRVNSHVFDGIVPLQWPGSWVNGT